MIPKTPLAEFFYVELYLHVNAYQCAKFQLPRSISFGDMQGSKNNKWGLLISPRCPPSRHIFICSPSRPAYSKKSSAFDEILYTAADFELDKRHVIKNYLSIGLNAYHLTKLTF